MGDADDDAPPWYSSPNHIVIALSPELVSPSSTDEQTFIRPKEMFVRIQGFSEPYSANEPCSRQETRLSGKVLLPRTSRSHLGTVSPKQSSNAVFLFPFTWYLSSNHPACRTECPWRALLLSRVVLRVQVASTWFVLPLHLVLVPLHRCSG